MFAKERYCNVLFLSTFMLFYLFPLKYCDSIYEITSSQPLLQGQTLVSNSQIFELGFFSPNNSEKRYLGVWYKQISPRRIVWVANRENPLTVDQASSASLRITANGNLELVDRKRGSLIWSTNVNALSNGSIALLLDNGNFVLKDGVSGDELWESFYHPADTFLPGAVFGFNGKNGENYVLTSWKNSSDPSPGDFVVGLAPRTPPEVFIWVNGTIPQWRSGPWDKSKFVGIPDMYAGYDSPFDLVEDEATGTSYFHFKSDNSSTSLLYVSSTGVFQLLLKLRDQDWYVNWEAPHNNCDFYGFCGPFGVCKATESPMCKCLKGFEPKSHEDWSRGNWTSGCVRQKELVCERNTSSADSTRGKIDGFKKMGSVKLPDFYEFVVTEYEEIESCEIWCLSNCSCLAYSYIDGIGCLVWSRELLDIQEFRFGGEDLFIRLSHEELVGGEQVKKIIISLSVISAVAAISGLLLYGLHKRRAKQKGKMTETTEKFDMLRRSNSSGDALQFSNQHDPPELPIFDFSSILVATENFSVNNKLGQGGFGSVYKGKLPDGKEIAVKRLSSSSGQGVEEFKNEILLISKLQHRNLVKLFGCCIEKEEKLLIYEFMPNKSLDLFIFDPKRREELTWATRFNIILGVARGLLYLHRDSCLRVIHRDLKVSNILLDEKMNPKISDFGLARIFQGTLDLANTHRIVGTLGYMSPEYAMSGIFSEKSDVFSFGVLLLEIVSGRKNTNFHYRDQQLSLISYAWRLWSEDRTIELADEAILRAPCSQEVIIRCIHVGLLCVQDRNGDRPNMADVVFMISNETDRPKPKQPMFTFQSSPKFETQPQNRSNCSASYEDTMSLIEGR